MFESVQLCGKEQNCHKNVRFEIVKLKNDFVIQPYFIS